MHGPSSAPTIAKALDTSAPTVTKHLRRAAIAGLVDHSGVKWELSFNGLSTLPGTPDEDTLTAAAITAEMNFAGDVELWRRLVKNAIASLGRARVDDPVDCRLRGALTVADKRLGDATPRTVKAMCEAIEPVLRQAMERQARREVIPPERDGRASKASTPPHVADLIRRKDTPAKTLLRHGLIAVDSMPAGTRSDLGRRYRSTVPGCWSIVWDGSTWADPEVEALRQAVLERRAAEAERPALPQLSPGDPVNGEGQDPVRGS